MKHPAWLGAVCLSTVLLPGLSAEPLYTEDFDTPPVYVGAEGPNENNLSSVAIGAGTEAGAPHVQPGQFGGTSQYLSGARVPGGMMEGTLSLGSDAPVTGSSRNRSCITWIDTSSAEVGQYRVRFDVRDLVRPDPSTRLVFHLLEGSHLDKGFVKLQLTQQVTLPERVSTLPLLKPGKGAQFGWVLVDQAIHQNGEFAVTFGLSKAGKPGDFLALVWTQFKGPGSAPMPSMKIDNVAVSALPHPTPVEPAEPLPSAPLGQSGDWVRLAGMSDEFDAAAIHPRKWNSNPASWGAWSWDAKNAWQADGRLHLQMVHEPHLRGEDRLFYKSGILRSHTQMTYGYYEARIKGCALFPGACPSFWTYSDGTQYTGEVRYCEVDFVELQMNELNQETGVRDPVEHIDMNLHLRLADEAGKLTWRRPGTHPELCANAWTAPWDPRDDFHVYGCDVTPETITWFIDGEQVAQKPNTHWHLPMNVTLSLGLRHPHIGWVGQNIRPVPQAATGEGFPTSMEVDYVRVWQRK